MTVALLRRWGSQATNDRWTGMGRPSHRPTDRPSEICRPTRPRVLGLCLGLNGLNGLTASPAHDHHHHRPAAARLINYSLGELALNGTSNLARSGTPWYILRDQRGEKEWQQSRSQCSVAGVTGAYHRRRSWSAHWNLIPVYLFGWDSLCQGIFVSWKWKKIVRNFTSTP